MATRFFSGLTVLVCICVLCACTSKPVVHLYARHLNETQIRTLENALLQQQLAVKVNQLPMPVSIRENTLLYSLLLRRADTIDKVTEAVASQGYSVAHEEPLTKGNHWYTGDSVALFLFPRGEHGGILAADIAAGYEVFDCPARMHLQLSKQGHYTLTGEDAKHLESNLKQGSWHVRQAPVVELRPQAGEHAYAYFTLSQQQTQDQISALTFTYLTPLQARFLPEGCRLRTAIRHE